ncbi:MAG: hypothetical protein K8E24_007580 [Methanobacterium paludis]|nr:hypothetical protein [Methanobacterium paludis]
MLLLVTVNTLPLIANVLGTTVPLLVVSSIQPVPFAIASVKVTLIDLFFFNLKTDELYLKPNMLEFKAMIPEGSYVPRTFKALMALMKYEPMTQELSSISPEDAEEIFKDIKEVESIQNASPEVLKRASLMLYQMVKEVSQ